MNIFRKSALDYDSTEDDVNSEVRAFLDYVGFGTISTDFVKDLEKKTLLNTIRKAMKNWNLSATEVMNGFEISPERQKELLPLI